MGTWLRRKLVGSSCLVGALGVLAGCGQDPLTQDPTGPDPLTRTPRDTTPLQGLDRGRLYRLVDELAAGRHGEVHSLLVLRNGETVIEEYFRGYGSGDEHSLQSVSKSFTSALIGIAIANGEISGVDEQVLDFFRQWREQLAQASRRAAMTIEDILTMRTGTDYHEVGANAPHWELNSLPTGWDQYWLNRPMINLPGSFWQYDSGGVIALSAMLKHRTSMHADEYANRWLFGPLGIIGGRWFVNQEGHPHTGGGLFLTPRHMVKLVSSTYNGVPGKDGR